ncbi:CehA/McbA family metallohydrolase [Mariniflexile sp.]|uniref:CehA/McbA family metallohydrolase n=2 Tax=Mariniflexile sp. TaxID=1979402 RepID=UPI00404790C0
MRHFIFSLFLLAVLSAQAQWSNRYPLVDGFGHHVYLEGYELPVLNGGPTDAAPSPSNDAVVFSAKGWLWVMDLNTSAAKRITFSSDMDFRPNWSPDGSKIAFVRDNTLNTQIVLIDLTTNEETILVNSDALDLDPIFSQDGKFIYYSSAKNGSFDLWKLDLSTLESTILTDDDSLERLPVPTNQGDYVVFLHKYGFSYDAIKLLDIAKGTSSFLVEENFVSQAAFTLAPDNKTLAYTWANGDDYELHLLNIFIPKSKMLLTKSNGLPLSPKFSYDGAWVYYTENNKNETSELERISVYGGSPEVLTVKKWDWGKATGTLKITSRVDGKIEAVRMSIIDQNGHPIIPTSGAIHSEGQNGIVFFYSPGEIEIEALIGNLTITAVHGFSTLKTVQEIKLESGANTTEMNLNRIWNAKQNGWYSGDNHFHLNYGGSNRLDPEDIRIDLKAEEIDIAFPLLANLGNRFLEEDLLGWENNSLPIISFGQEVRSHFLGHLNLIGTKELYWPWVWGPYYDIYEADDRLNAEPLRFAHEKGGLGGYVHPVEVRDPFKEGNARGIPISLTADVVLGEVDILEVGCLWTDEIGTAALWHEFLNLGIPIALSAGSDVMNDLYRTMAIGATRVYVNPEGEFSQESYLEALKKGKSFVSNGPQILFSVDDKEVGDVIKSNKKKAKWKLTVHSPVPYDQAEIFVNGKVVWSQKSKKGTSETYTGTIVIPEGGWITARVSGTKSEWPMMDSFIFAESSPLWFNEIGSTMQSSKVNAAEKLLEILKVSEQSLNKGYGENKIPNLEAHFSKAKEKLVAIISGGKQ